MNQTGRRKPSGFCLRCGIYCNQDAETVGGIGNAQRGGPFLQNCADGYLVFFRAYFGVSLIF